MPNESTVVGKQIVRNSTLTRDWLCAVCFADGGGALVEKWFPDGWRVVCANNETHTGFIHKSEAHLLIREANLLLRSRTQKPPVLCPLGLEDNDYFD